MKAMNLTRWLKGVNEVVVKNLDISINQKSAVMTIEKTILHRAKKKTITKTNLVTTEILSQF